MTPTQEKRKTALQVLTSGMDYRLPKEKRLTQKYVLKAMEQYASLKCKEKDQDMAEAEIQIGLGTIEINHLKTLLASCEKSLNDREQQNKELIDLINIMHKSLCTYGSHPIIDKQVQQALSSYKGK